MKTYKNPTELESMAESVKVYLDGQEIVAHIDWDPVHYYIWLTPSDSFEEFCEEIERDDLLIGLENDLAQYGVQTFDTLEEVNAFLRRICGDNNPAMFYTDDVFGEEMICGA